MDTHRGKVREQAEIVRNTESEGHSSVQILAIIENKGIHKMEIHFFHGK